VEGELLFVAAADVDVEVPTGFVADTISLSLSSPSLFVLSGMGGGGMSGGGMGGMKGGGMGMSKGPGMGGGG